MGMRGDNDPEELAVSIFTVKFSPNILPVTLFLCGSFCDSSSDYMLPDGMMISE
jgi:hypothetical protein